MVITQILDEAGSPILDEAGQAILQEGSGSGPPPVTVPAAATGTSTYDYGLSSVEITTATSDCLVVLAGWDLSTAATDASMPAVNVTDSAGNKWYHVTTTGSGTTGSRSAAFICPNADTISWLSVSATTFVSSLAYVVLELDNMAPLYDLDLATANDNSSATSLTLNPGVTTSADFTFAIFTTGAITSPPATPAGWTAVTPVSAGASGPNPVQIFPYFGQFAQGTNLAATFTVSSAVPVSGALFAVRAHSIPPVQLNQNFPVLKVEAAFGSVPGDPSQAPPADPGGWTDITSRVIGPPGQAYITSNAGRQYELSQAEAGTLEIWLNNSDGAFTPGNVNSPYAPGTGVVLETPVRVSAFWAGEWFSVAYGWVERWPQEWPDLPQWGISKMIATDAISVLAAVTMQAALDSDLLLDSPYVLINAGEQYLTFSNGLNSFGGSGTAALGYYSVADAQGLLAQNYSRVNVRNGIYVDGNSAATGGNGPAIAATGQTTTLLGSANTGFGTTAITTAPTSPASGPGIIYTDPAMPDPVDTTGVTVSFWVIIPPPGVSAASLQPVVFTAFGPPSSYRTQHASLSVQILNFASANTLQVTLADGSTVTAPFSPSAAAQMITLTVTSTSLSIYVNGALQTSVSLSAAQTTTWNAVALGCPNYAYASGGLVTGSFTAFDLALYGYQLPVQRIVSNYATGIGGQQNVDAIARVAQILSWANLGIARGGRSTFNGASDGILQGPAYSLAGATAADAVNQIAVNETSMVAAMPGGALVYFHKWALFNQFPVAVFGDNPNPGAGEVPSLQATSWGYDDTYLQNTVQITQQYGANNLFTFTAEDFTSQAAYFSRSAQAQTITTSSSLDAQNSATWQIAKYSQPSLRVSGLTVDAASNPQAAFRVILSLLQGQVATVSKSPLGGAPITQDVLIQKVSHAIGPSMWGLSLQLSPYVPESSVLELDAPGFDVVGDNFLA